LRRGLWVASGFGRQGLNTSAIAGRLIAQSILLADQRWRLFSPFELVWAGGLAGRVAGQAIGIWKRRSASAAGSLARYRERARARARIREARLEKANRQAAMRPPTRRPPPRPLPVPQVITREPAHSDQGGEGAGPRSLPASQES
jgi:hypothetical protein